MSTDRQTDGWNDRSSIRYVLLLFSTKGQLSLHFCIKMWLFWGYQNFQSFDVEWAFVQVNEATLFSSALFTPALTATCCTVGNLVMKLSRHFDRQQHATQNMELQSLLACVYTEPRFKTRCLLAR